MNLNDLLGSLLQRGMTDSSQRRIENSLNDDSLGGILEREFGVTRPAASSAPESRPEVQLRMPETVPSTPRSAPSSADSRRRQELPTDRGAPGKSSTGGGLGGLGDLFSKQFKQAAGAGALALLASIAMKALSGSRQGSQKFDSAARLAGGLSEPGNVEQQQHVQSLAELTIKAMLNAAKADGRIDEDELQKVIGELKGDTFTNEEREFLQAEVRKPMCTEEIVQAVPNRQVAAQLYAASLLAIEVDTPAEKAYMQQFARDCGLDDQVVNEIHSVLGVR